MVTVSAEGGSPGGEEWFLLFIFVLLLCLKILKFYAYINSTFKQRKTQSIRMSGNMCIKTYMAVWLDAGMHLNPCKEKGKR